MFRSDYPRGIVIRLRLWWFAALDALSIPPTLISPPIRFSGGPMGGDDSQKLRPWRGTYSSPGRGKISGVQQHQHFSRLVMTYPQLAALSLGRMCTRNMLVA